MRHTRDAADVPATAHGAAVCVRRVPVPTLIAYRATVPMLTLRRRPVPMVIA
jgi:hypothetical protein